MSSLQLKPGICSLNLQLLKIGVKKKAASVFKLTGEKKKFFFLLTLHFKFCIFTLVLMCVFRNLLPIEVDSFILLTNYIVKV